VNSLSSEAAARLDIPKRSPFDVKKEYSDFMSFIDKKKQEETESYYSKLPYKFGYLILILIVLSLLVASTVSAYNAILEKERNLESEADTCLVKFSNKKCDVTVLNDECRELLQCLKKKEDQMGAIQFFITVISNDDISIEMTIKSISSDILGPILLAITGIMIKLLELMTDRKDQDKKDH